MVNCHFRFNVSKVLFLGVLLLLGLLGCQDNTLSLAVNKEPLSEACWISDGRPVPTSDSLFYGDDPAPVFLKSFKTQRQPVMATLYIAAAGYYTARLNGDRVGEDYLEPAWTHFSKRVYYRCYDVTSLLNGHRNHQLEITVGNGFYNPLPLLMWGDRNMRREMPTGRPSLIARLEITYKNGARQNIYTDGSWSVTASPIVRNNVYLGIVYDGRAAATTATPAATPPTATPPTASTPAATPPTASTPAASTPTATSAAATPTATPPTTATATSPNATATPTPAATPPTTATPTATPPTAATATPTPAATPPATPPTTPTPTSPTATATQTPSPRATTAACVTGGPGGTLQEAFFPGVQVVDRFPAQNITALGKRQYLVDFGTNLTGIYRIKIHAHQGDTVKMRFGERLYPDGTLNPMTTVCGQIKRAGMGGPGAPDIAWQEDVFVAGAHAEQGVWFEPDFTFHVFRYMEITGLAKAPQLEHVTALALCSNFVNTNQFSCNVPLINQIQQMARRTFLNNFVGVQTDCSAREKFGYGGDLNAVNNAYIYNFDMEGCYRKTVYDWLDAMKEENFIDTAPYTGIQYCGLNWESAYLITQYQLFINYNDTSFVAALYDHNLQWMDKVARLHPDGVVREGLSDHESLVNVPVALTGTTNYIYCTRIMQHFSRVMNRPDCEQEFAALEQDLTQKVLDLFWYKPWPEALNKQTLYATLLYFDLIPEKERPKAVAALVDAVQEGPAGHFTTGMFGTKYILEVLSRYGHAQMVYDIVNSTDFPGWGFMAARGATTIWETWKESDNTYSNCHPMFGSISAWFYRYLAGIRPLEAYPGYTRFVVAPCTPLGLDRVTASYNAPQGLIQVAWVKDAGTSTYTLTIPAGTQALVTLPVAAASIITTCKDHQPAVQETASSFRRTLLEGRYEITVKNALSNL